MVVTIVVALIVGGVMFVMDGFQPVFPTSTSVIAVIIGLWSGTRFPRGVRWTRRMQTMVLMTALFITLVPHLSCYEINGVVLALMIGITAIHLVMSLQNAQVYSRQP